MINGLILVIVWIENVLLINVDKINSILNKIMCGLLVV